MAFVCLIKTLNGEPVTDFTEGNIRKVLKDLDRKRLTVAKVRAFIDHVKKKIEEELEIFFRELIDTTAAKEHFLQLKKRTSFVLQGLIDGKDYSETVTKIEDRIFQQNPPGVFYGSDGLEVEFVLGFDETCTILNQHVPINPRLLVVREFYKTLETVKEQIRKANKKS